MVLYDVRCRYMTCILCSEFYICTDSLYIMVYAVTESIFIFLYYIDQIVYLYGHSNVF